MGVVFRYLRWLPVLLVLLKGFTKALPTTHASPSLSSPTLNYTLVFVLPSTRTNLVYRQSEQAARLAVQEINADVLGDSKCRLRLDAVESRYSGWNVVSQLGSKFQASSDVVAVAGLVSSAEVRAASSLSLPMNLAILTTGATDSGLTTGVIPNLHRVCTTDHDLPTALIELILLYSWSEFTLLHSDAYYGERSRLNIVEQASLRSITVSSVVNIAYTDDSPSASIYASLSGLKASGSKIIVCNLPVDYLLPVLRAAKALGMLSSTYAWIGTQLTSGIGLLDAELVGLLNGTLWLQPAVSSAMKSAFRERLANSGATPSPRAEENFALDSMYSYDAIKQVGTALDKCCLLMSDGSSEPLPILEFGNLALQSQTMSSCVQGQLRNLNFTSVTGNFVSFQSKANLIGDRTDASYEVVNVVGREERLVARWSTSDRLVSLSAPAIIWPGGGTEVPSGRSFFRGVLKVLVPISAPFGFVPGGAYSERDRGTSHIIPQTDLTNANFSGVAVDLLREIARRTGFEYQLHLYPYGTWTDMVALVGNESSPWDLAIGSITVTKDRAQTANFTRTIFLSGIQMLVLRPTEVHAGVWAFVLPLHWHLWLVLWLMLIAVAVVMLYLDRRAIAVQKVKGLPVADSIFFSFSSFFFAHEPDNLQRPFSRVFISIVMFAILIIGAAYTAQLSFYLSTRKGSEPVQDIADLPSLWVGSRYGGTNYPYVTGELGLRSVRIVSGRNDMLRALRNGSISAYLADIPHIETIAGTECDTMTTGRRVYTQQYAFAAKKNAVWLDGMNRAISVLLQNGVVTSLYKRYVPNTCPPVVSIDTIKALTVEDLLSMVYLIAIATGLTVLWKLLHLLLIRPWRRGRISAAHADHESGESLANGSDMTLAYNPSYRDSGVSGMLCTPTTSVSREGFDDARPALSEGIFSKAPPSPEPFMTTSKKVPHEYFVSRTPSIPSEKSSTELTSKV